MLEYAHDDVYTVTTYKIFSSEVQVVYVWSVAVLLSLDFFFE
jgi:hypothetical protein